jgi:hypothetical protein
MKLQYESELYHFGIKGMHWGIRRFQNKDGTLTEAGKKRVKRQGAARDKLQEETGRSDHTISKGTSIYRVADPGEKLTSRRIYASVLDQDRDEYRALANEPDMLGNNAADFQPVEYEYKARSDLRVVTPQQQYDYIYEKFGDTTVKDLYAKRTVEKSSYTEREAKVLNEFIKKYGNTKMSALKGDMDFLYENDKDFRTGYGYSYSSGSSKERQRIGKYATAMYNIDRRFFKSTLLWKSKDDAAKDKILSPKHYEMQEHFKKLGYQALVDLEDWGAVAEYPLIVMDPKTNLKKVKENKL